MNCHQILSGACNAGDHCYAVGSVEGVPFTAYAAGCNIVILASSFERVQIIPGAWHNYIRISCLDCSTDTGKIAAAYENQVCIFEPTPLIHTSSTHHLDYRWVQTGSLQTESHISSLSWNLEGTRLLTGGEILQMWRQHPATHDGEYDPESSTGGVTFEIGEDSTAAAEDDEEPVSNMLVTSCRDNICRVWVETVLPEDGLVNMNQFDPRATQNPKFRTHRHKHRFLQRLRHMKTCFHIRRHAKSQQPSGAGTLGGITAPIPTLPSTYSVHDFHSYGYHGTGLTPGLHFHLAASINAETDIPLVPSLVTGDPDLEPNFVLHWLNNKEMHFSLQAESMLHEMTRKQVEREEASAAASGTDGSGREVHEGSQNDTDPEEHSPRKRVGRVAKAASQDESSEEQHGSAHSSGHSHPSLSATTSINSLATDAGPAGAGAGLADPLDAAIECLLRDWHHNPDLLFAIHPIDGSLFRQAQVSFASRLPSTFPLGDAMTMSTSICLYNAYGCHFGDREPAAATLGTARGTSPPAPPSPGVMGLEDAPSATALLPSVQEEVEGSDGPQSSAPAVTAVSPATEAAPAAENESQKSTGSVSADPSPTVSMVTKHSNGTLNLWQLTFADKSKFSQVLTIGHACRASGHRFRVNDITCHPVLPLLLTTSHHNISDVPVASPSRSPLSPAGRGKDVTVPTGFCSELILWRVDAVGPLSRSGGVSELARINSPEISAFSNVAWIPTLLPSTTLGNLSNSPSACFVASDGHSLRVYQAVIDARTLLAEVNSSERRSRMLDSLVSLSTDTSSEDGLKHTSLHDHIRIVSQQSTARPGCVIQLDAISDANHDWQNTQFLHVFQEQLITGERTEERGSSNVGGVSGVGGPTAGAGDASNTVGAADLGLMHSELGAMVDLQQSSVFEEPFYIVVLEKTGSESILHMWRLVIASQPDSSELSGSMMYVPDSQLIQDEEEPEVGGGRSASMAGVENDTTGPQQPSQASHVVISTTKVCTQVLPLPDGVEVVHAAPAAGHLSSASIYPACFAPYILVTACSDSTIRFWKCKISGGEPPRRTYEWCEWEMSRRGLTSAIDITGQPLNISAAYSGRIACAYKYGKSFTRPSKNDPDSRFVNLCVAIYECESTGGSEWVLEDTIHLKNIHLPRMQLHPQLDLSVLHERPRRFGEERSTRRNGGDDIHGSLHKSGTSLTAVPSFSTLQSLRRSIIECGNTCPLTQKHLVQLDWVSKEDGSHILTVAVGSK
ncbi:Rabconnectin, partial [Gryllus bimaculatus]